MTSLEGAYRRILRTYPRWYRVRREDEILGTLLETAGPDQRRPRAGEPFLTVGPAVYLAWVLAAVVDVVTRSRHRRSAVLLALAVTVLAVPVGNAFQP